jgi:hypothetical protein
MSIIRTRPISDPLSQLQLFIQQSEQAGAGLISVVAGTVQSVPFNVVTFVFEPATLPSITLQKLTDPIDTDEQQAAVQQQLVAQGLTPLFFAPVFDSNQQVNIAVCRSGPVAALLPPAPPLGTVTPPPPPAGGATPTGVKPVSTPGSHGSFRGSSSNTTGLTGNEATFDDGSAVTDAQETLSAVRGPRDFGSKTVAQHRVTKGNQQTVQQAQYCWGARQLPDAVLTANFQGFPSDVPVITGKATQFGKNDTEDEGTGSELLKIVQTNSDVFGASLKMSRLIATFGSGLGSSTQLLNAMVEIFNPASGMFARVPIVDVGPAEHLTAEIDLTLALDRYLKTDGSAQVQFRIVV